MNNGEIMQMLNYVVGDNLNIQNVPNTFTNPQNQSCWQWWQTYYYPQIIKESYPVYIQERAMDKGQKAFEIIKMLKDKKLIELKTVSDFIEAMDALIKVL